MTKIEGTPLIVYVEKCGQKSTNRADPSLNGLPQIPGVAVFAAQKGDASYRDIDRVGYLVKKYGKGERDWEVAEYDAQGKATVSKLGNNRWRWWGVPKALVDKEQPAATDKNARSKG